MIRLQKSIKQMIKNVCLISEEYPPDTMYGGIGTYNKELSLILRNRGYRVYVIAGSTKNKSYISHNGDILVYRVTPFFRKYFFLKKLIGYRLAVFCAYFRLSKKRIINIIETPEWKADFFIGILLKKIFKLPPIIIRLHGCRALIRKYDNSSCSFSDRIVIALEKYCIIKSDYISSITLSCLKETESILNLTLNQKAVIIPNPTSNPASDINYETIPDEFVGKRIILFVGRIEYLKGVFHLSKAMKNIMSKYDDVIFVIAGRDIKSDEGNYYNSKIVRDELNLYTNRVIFTGQISSNILNKLYKIAYVTVLPSFFESFGLCCVESIKYGTPVIAGRNGGMGEIIRNNIDGILIDPNDINDITSAISRLLDDNNVRNSMSVRCLERFLTSYSRENISNQITSYYDKITNNENICNSSNI